MKEKDTSPVKDPSPAKTPRRQRPLAGKDPSPVKDPWSAREKKTTPLHRLFGLGLTALFSDMNYRVELEKDLSLKRQMLDAIVIEEEVSEPGSSGLEDPPDGPDDLGKHNLMTYKSHQESLNAWAVDELLGHFVNYRKLASRDKTRLVPVKDFRLFAVSALSKEAPFGSKSRGDRSRRLRGQVGRTEDPYCSVESSIARAAQCLL